MNKIKIIIILCSLIWVIHELDHKAAKLEYVGKVTLDHPFPVSGICDLTQGKNLEKNLDHTLSSKHLKAWIRDFSHGSINYEIKWINGFVLDRDDWYYMGFGCRIEKITYYYHSRYTNFFKDSSLFEVSTLSTTPADNQSVIIYKCDVHLIPAFPDDA